MSQTILEWMYALCSCLNVKELFTLNRRNIWSLSDSNRNWYHNQLVRRRTLNHLSLLETHKVYLPFSCKRWTSTKTGRFKVSGYLCLSPNMEMYYCTPWAKQEKNGTPLFWLEVTFEWYEGAVVFCVSIFIFCLETTV